MPLTESQNKNSDPQNKETILLSQYKLLLITTWNNFLDGSVCSERILRFQTDHPTSNNSFLPPKITPVPPLHNAPPTEWLEGAIVTDETVVPTTHIIGCYTALGKHTRQRIKADIEQINPEVLEIIRELDYCADYITYELGEAFAIKTDLLKLDLMLTRLVRINKDYDTDLSNHREIFYDNLQTLRDVWKIVLSDLSHNDPSISISLLNYLAYGKIDVPVYDHGNSSKACPRSIYAGIFLGELNFAALASLRDLNLVLDKPWTNPAESLRSLKSVHLGSYQKQKAWNGCPAKEIIPKTFRKVNELLTLLYPDKYKLTKNGLLELAS